MAPEIRITVWRPVSWDGDYLDTSTREPASLSNLHEPVYRYEVSDSPFDGVPSPEVTASLKDALARFAPQEPLEQRTIAHLRELVAQIFEILASQEVDWMDSPEEIVLAADELPVQKRQNRLLAFASRLQWLCDTFETIPEVSVSMQ